MENALNDFFLVWDCIRQTNRAWRGQQFRCGQRPWPTPGIWWCKTIGILRRLGLGVKSHPSLVRPNEKGPTDWRITTTETQPATNKSFRFGQCAGWWPLRAFYRQILSLAFFEFSLWNFSPRLARELLARRYKDPYEPIIVVECDVGITF